MVHTDSTRPKSRLSVSSQPFVKGICLLHSLQPSTGFSISRPALPPASLHCSNNCTGYRNIRLLSIAYACCLGLGPDLPWDDERCPGSLRLSVGRILTVLFATHTGILTAILSTAPSGTASPRMVRSPTQIRQYLPQLRFCTSAPVIFGAGPLDQ